MFPCFCKYRSKEAAAERYLRDFMILHSGSGSGVVVVWISYAFDRVDIDFAHHVFFHAEKMSLIYILV